LKLLEDNQAYNRNAISDQKPNKKDKEKERKKHTQHALKP